MAKQVGFCEKVVAKLKRDARYAWARRHIEDARVLVADMVEEDWPLDDGLFAEGFIPCLQQEAVLRSVDERVIVELGYDLDQPFVFEGLMAAWDAKPVMVEFDFDAVCCIDDGDVGYEAVTQDAIRSLFPACMLLDVRSCGVKLYGVKVEALFVYPSFDSDRGYEMLLGVGVNVKKGFRMPFESKIVLKGGNLEEMMKASVEERERLRDRCFAGLDRGMHDEMFSPTEDEERIMVLMAQLLGLMLWGGTVVERSERRGIEQLRVRLAGEGEGAGEIAEREEGTDPRALSRENGVAGCDGDARGTEPGGPSRGAPRATGRESALSEESAVSGDSVGAGASGESCELGSETGEGPQQEQPETVLQTSDELPANDTGEGDGSGARPAGVPQGEAALAGVSQTGEGFLQEQPEVVEQTSDALSDDDTGEGDGPGMGTVGVPWVGTEPAGVAQVEWLRGLLEAQERKCASLEFHLRQAQEAAEEARRAAASVGARAALFDTFEVPTTPAEALELAARAYPDRIVVLPEARKSAEEFRKGSAAEVWAVLRSIAVSLHPLVFAPGGGSVIYAFEEQTGFELTLREMKPIKKSGQLAKYRTVEYAGREHDMSAHVKGKGSKRGESLRVHFFVDHDEGRIVIGHCGEHLPTFDTSRI